MARLKLGVLISGRGSNLQALLDAAADPAYPAEVVLVLANVADAGGLGRAAGAGVAHGCLDHRRYPTKAAFEQAIDGALTAAGVELVCLAGFMRILSPWFVDRWRDRLINIHPSLLPAFPGLDTHARTLAAGARWTGCTVHFVRSEVDSGPIIVQAAVPVRDDDTAETLAGRVLWEEHRCYPLAIRLIAEGRVRLDGQAVRLAAAAWAEGPGPNPRG